MVAFLLLTVFVVIIVLAIAFARMSVLSTRLGDLESRLRKALGLIADLEKKIQGTEIQKVAKPEKVGRSLRKRPGSVRLRKDAGKTIPAISSPQPPVTPPAAALSKPSAPSKSRTRGEWEALIGGKLLNRIGALALILGVGFFLQYAFANDWITEPVRVMVGVAVGLTLLAGAARSALRGFQIFAQGLVGAGIAILYLSVYASFNYYHLVTQPWAFVFMSAITVITFTQAFRYDSIVVALLGLLGGFLTPFLLSTGEVNPVGLFTYLALLDAGLLVVAWRRDAWMSIEPLSMAGTYLIYALWFGQDYDRAYFVPGLLFLALFWLMFHAVHVQRIVRNAASHRRFRLVLASLHVVVFYVLLYQLVDNGHAEWRVPATLTLAILYGVTSLTVRRRPGDEGVFIHSTLTAIVLVVCATWIQFKGMALVQYFSVEALALVWAGTQWRLRWVWACGTILFALSFLILLGTAGALFASSAEPFTLLFNNRAFTFLLLVVCLGLSAVLLGRVDRSGNGRVRMLLHIAWCWVLFILITVETNDAFAQMIRNAGVTREQHLDFLRAMAMPAAWGAYALSLILGGGRQNLRAIASSGLLVLLIAGCLAIVRGLTYVPIAEFVSLLNERVLFLTVIVAEHALALRLLSTRPGTTAASAGVRAGLQAGILLLILVMVTGETWDYFSRGIYGLALAAGTVNIGEELSRLQNLRQLFLSASWLGFSILLMSLGIWKRARIMRIEAIVLFGVSIVKIFIYDLSFLDTLYRIFSFVGLGVILLVVSYLYQRYRGIILGSEETGARA